MAGGRTGHMVQAGFMALPPGWAARFVMFGVMAAVLGWWGQGSYAQTLKKYVTPDGHTVYSDKPVPGARLIGELQAPPPLDQATVDAARQREAASSAEARRFAEKRLQEQAKERQRTDDASAKLKRAQDALEQGRAPKPGERIGTAGGGMRFTEDYLDRQRTNEEAVKRAEEDLNRTRQR